LPIQIHCHLTCYETGTFIAQELNEDFFRPVYDSILKLMEDLKENAYHWGRFTDARKRWAREAMCVFNRPPFFCLTKYLQECSRCFANPE
jgi:hypothetical protein